MPVLQKKVPAPAGGSLRVKLYPESPFCLATAHGVRGWLPLLGVVHEQSRCVVGRAEGRRGRVSTDLFGGRNIH